MSRIVAYVTTVSAAAIAAAFWVFNLDPRVEVAYFQAALCFAGLALVANALAHTLPRGAFGSIAFIPYLSAALLAPHWLTVVVVGATTLADGVMTRRAAIKTLFNVSQTVLAVSLSIALYHVLGGSAVLDAKTAAFLPLGALVAVFLTANTLAVSGAIAVSQGRNIWQVWRQNTGTTVIYDLMSLPIAYAFSKVYAEFGMAWTAALAIPLLGLRQLYKINWQLEKVNQELLELMVAAIEARDPYTSGHSRRVSRSARIIARAIGLSSREIDRVGIAALLHDVGKIHEVYAPILRKPDRLTKEEQAIMQTHPIKSAELVQNVSQLKDVVAAIRHHHENWDGTGYPDGRAGEEIPLAARIVMIADTIDAMTTDRPYRNALGADDVRRELQRLRGVQFDPEICDTLLNSPLYSHLFAGSNSAPTPVHGIIGSAVLRHRRAASGR